MTGFNRDEAIVLLALEDKEEWEQEHILRVLENFNTIQIKKEQFKMMHDLIKNHGMQLTKLVKFFDISISGYYKWLNSQKINQLCPIKQRNMEIIKKIYNEHTHHIGCRKIQRILSSKYNIKLNYKTVNNYMARLSLLRECDICKREEKLKASVNEK